MKILDKHFSSIHLMTLDPESDRAKRSIEGIEEFTDNLRVVKGIRGDELPPARWYKAGNGAWGCLQTHIRIAQDEWLRGGENYLVFEDDVVFGEDFEDRLEDFMSKIPENWDQIYLGGQHRRSPRWVNDAVYDARSVNRTHCFALKRDAIPEFLKHVTDFEDHIKSSFPKHIDHRLEDAHRARRWVTYSPSWWLVGQGENDSQINGRWHPDKWWDYNSGVSGKLPFIWVDREPTEGELKHLHFGWADRKEGFKYLDPYFQESQKNPGKGMRVIAQEAFECRRLGAVAFYEDENLEVDPFLKSWEGPVLKLSELTEGKIKEICDYPRNGIFKHRWFSGGN